LSIPPSHFFSTLLVAGASLLLPAGSPAPTNYRFVGTFILTGAPPKAEKMHVDVYRHH